ncbi:MAG TPA: ATP synthase subunit I [Thermoanaerobaculia bacterium]|nr:ATP synthase subunit I [Thermoanaerobaculia bacterium]
MRASDELVEARAGGSGGRSPLLARLRKYAIYCYLFFGLIVTYLHGLHGLLELTCFALVAIVNFLWLEEIADGLLQPAPQKRPWKMVARALARFALLGLALAVVIFVIGYHPVSVLLGFSVIVGAIMIEAVCSIFRSEKLAR